MRIRWGRRSTGRAQPRHRNNFDFDFGANNNQPLGVESGQAAACGKSSERRKGEGRCRRGEDKQRGAGLRQQRGRGLRRCRRRCRHCCCYRCRHRMPPRQLRQLRHYCLCSSSGSSGGSRGLRRCAVAAAADSRMPSLTPDFLFFLLNVRYTWHRIHHVKGPSLRNSGSEIPEQINLALE